MSVSQQPIDFGENVCVGKIGRSWLSLYRQLYAGVLKAKTRYVAVAEHDCVYSKEHFRFRPSRDDTFFYNDNCWLVQYEGRHEQYNGMFSFIPRRFALSQLVCSRNLLARSLKRRLYVLDRDMGLESTVDFLGEPGRSRLDMKKLSKLRTLAESGKSAYLRPLLKYFAQFLEQERSEVFRTKTPNIDIRHGTNFTGPRRGKRRRFVLEPWGSLPQILTKGDFTSDRRISA